jgi:hypothetical protein
LVGAVLSLLTPPFCFPALAATQTTPDQLPRNVLDQLEGWLAQNRTLLDGERKLCPSQQWWW